MSQASNIPCRVHALAKTYDNAGTLLHVVRPLDLEIRCGELTLLMGPSGSGKTTLLSMLAGLLQPTSGRVELFGHELGVMSEKQRAALRRRQVGFIFQQDNLFPALTALDNVAEILRLAGMSKATAYARATETLGRVGLADRLDHYPNQLSGGQRQRVAIARALAPNPQLVFGDEVTAALDGASAFTVMDLLREYVTPNSAVLIVTHDHRLERYADRVIAMEDGALAGDRRIRTDNAARTQHAAPGDAP